MYSNGTATVTNSVDRLGRRTNIVDAIGSRFLAYDASGQLLSETNASGTLAGLGLDYGFDKLLRRTNQAVRGLATSLSQTFAYDSASRLTNASDGTYNAGYSYLANSPLVSQISFRSNSTVRMTTTKQYDYLNRLMSISSAGSGSAASPIASTYLYNDANQRVQVRQEDGTYWLYEYDKLGQLTSGKRYWSDNTPVAGQQFEYAYDDIGNRTSTKAGGNDSGAGLRPATYGANNLNQYTNRTVPSAADVIGIAYPTATVTANGASAYRKGEYFWKQLSLGNTSAPLWTNISVVASLSGTNQTNSGYLFLPKATELYTYDADGNLTSDGRWTNRWDAENRLFEMESLSSAPTGSLVRMQFAYDHQSRRTSKVVSNWTGSAWQLTTNLFLYDGWNLFAELNGGKVLERSYLWGLDLSGSPQGAGGVGGLLALSTYNSQPSTHFYAYDGNGNVRGMIAGKDGKPTARYDSGPFAEPVRSSGAMAAANPMRFSTKYQDGDSDFVYYGYRFYNSKPGSWLSRDPAEERGGINIYCYIGNVSVNNFDMNGAEPPLLGYRNDCLLRGGSWAPDPYGESPAPDGCSAPASLVGDPNNPSGGCSFEAACNNHDVCYSDCSKSRSLCDSDWHEAMRNSCRACLNNIPMADRVQFLADCYGWADLYYTIVFALGGSAYDRRQESACHCNMCPRPGRR